MKSLRTNISLPKSLMAAAQRQMRYQMFSDFSGYVQECIRRDLNGDWGQWVDQLEGQEKQVAALIEAEAKRKKEGAAA